MANTVIDMAEIFEIYSIEEGESHHSFAWSSEKLGLECPQCNFLNDVTLKLVCFRMGLTITCTGWVTTEVEAECARCLKKFSIDIREPIDFAVQLTMGAPTSAELWEEDMISLNQAGGKLDLTPRIKDAVILGIPPHALCSDNCKGLCCICGKNLNKVDCGHAQKKQIDDRWEKLKELMKVEKKTKKKSASTKRRKK